MMQAPMRLLDFEEFKVLGKIPRSDNNEICSIYLSDIVNRTDTFIIFVSHRWFCPHKNPYQAHPDTKENIKFNLIVEAVDSLLNLIGRDVKVFLWIDYYCIDQFNEEDKKKGIQSLAAYISNSDCLFSPFSNAASRTIEDHKSFTSPLDGLYGGVDLKFQCLADNWNEYFGRAWCSLEMFIGNYSLLPPNGFNYFSKRESHRADRPHFFYLQEVGFLLTLPKLTHSWLAKLDPKKGALSDVNDEIEISNIMDAFSALSMVQERVGYSGESKNGKRVGFGSNIYENGDKYEGYWVNDKRHGVGTMYYANGDKYEGNWSDDKQHGKGLRSYVDGNRAQMNHKVGVLDGLCVMHHANGDREHMEWKDGKRHGLSVFYFANGDLKEAQYREGRRCSNPKIYYAGEKRAKLRRQFHFQGAVTHFEDDSDWIFDNDQTDCGDEEKDKFRFLDSHNQNCGETIQIQTDIQGIQVQRRKEEFISPVLSTTVQPSQQKRSCWFSTINCIVCKWCPCCAITPLGKSRHVRNIQVTERSTPMLKNVCP